MGRLSIGTTMFLAIPAFAIAQHHGGAASAPASAGRSAPVITRAAPTPMRSSVHGQSGTPSSARIGAPVVHTRNGVRIIHRNNGANFAFNGNDFSDVPGLGFDFPHLAAVSGNRRHHGGRFADGFPFGFSGFLLSPPVIVEEVPVADAQAAEEEVVDDAPVQRPERRSRASRASEPERDSAPAAPAPLQDAQQYVFVRRDGSLVFAVGYTWENGTLRYVTPEGFRRSMGRDALDLNATQQFNEQRGLDFRAPA